MDSIFYGVERQELATLAFDFATVNKIPHPFTNGKAGEQWLQNFIRRNPTISLRKPEPTSVARARGFNKPQVTRFFNNSAEIMEKYKFQKSQMWNVDETGKFLLNQWPHE